MAYEINGSMCSCCHRCRVLCPKAAITFKGAKYWIDPEKCIDCGLCERNCHNCAISKVGAIPNPIVHHAPMELECDVAVCGGGGSGLVAAVRLAQAGKHVIVLEKNKYPGGNTWYASGFHGHYSRLQEEAGEPDGRDAVVEELLKGTDYLPDPELARNAVYASGYMTDWLIDNCDCAEDFRLGPTPFGGLGVMFENRTGKKYHRIDASIGPGGMGSFIVDKLVAQCKKLNVPILTGHQAKKLLTDPQGQICGVVAQDAGGEITVHSKAVVMATGCYSHNPEYQAIANPRIPECTEPVHLFSVPTCTGDGITMCKEVGAWIDWENAKAMLLGPAHHPFSFAAVCITREADVVLINKNGKRWASEVDNTMGLRDIILDQPDRLCWAILDQGTLDLLANRLCNSPRTDREHREIIANYQAEIDAEAQMDMPVKKADTLEELAELMGVPVDAFVEEIQNYNLMCQQGEDTQFGKPAQFLHPLDQGPYYAFYEKMFQENASGGMKVDAETRVKKENGEIIPGLYAVGDNSAGLLLGTGDYSDVLERIMSMLTWAFTSGYMAAGAVLKDFA